MQVSAFPAIFKADFGRFRRVLAVSAAGRYDPIWPIRPDFGRISPVRRELKPIRHESSRISVNRAESARIREKKKTQMRSDARATVSDTASRVAPRRTRVRHLWCRVRAFQAGIEGQCYVYNARGKTVISMYSFIYK